MYDYEQKIDYIDRGHSTQIPESCAVDKTEYILNRRQVIADMKAEIKSTEKAMKGFKDKMGPIYEGLEKRLKKCREIIKNCEFSISLTTKQLEIEKAVRTRSK